MDLLFLISISLTFQVSEHMGKIEKAQKELEDERRNMELERIRLFESEKSSRAESGIGLTPPEVETTNCIHWVILNIS